MYDIFYISTGVDDQWLSLKKKYPTAIKLENVKSIDEINSRAFTKMFWVIWDNLILNDDFNLNEYKASRWDDMYIHVFKNGEHYDGICLFPKNIKITVKEFDYRFFTEKKEVDIQASTPIIEKYDVIFISYNEPNADNNYNNLLKICPDAKRVNGVKGIHQAHIVAAELATTDMFYVVDGDAIIVEDFNFDNYIPKIFKDHVHVWRSKNPVNDLVYGYGGVKLLPREKTINMDTSKPDMTTSITSKFKPVLKLSNISAFNTDPFNTWKSAFRECVKLSSRSIDRQKETETIERLKIWCTIGQNAPFGEFAIAGARSGAEYGNINRGNIEALKLINDFKWLKERFDGRYSTN